MTPPREMAESIMNITVALSSFYLNENMMNGLSICIAHRALKYIQLHHAVVQSF